MLKWLKAKFGKDDPAKDRLGVRGENHAARYLRQKGYSIILRNYRTGMGEIDIIARDGDTLVFVEVKTRANDDPSPETQVHAFKQRQITKMARLYLSKYGIPLPPARFDVIAIVWPDDQPPTVRHTINAFDATF